jgi:hypothetical protein
MPLSLAQLIAPTVWAPPFILLLGCASREVPTHYPESSAASPGAAVGAPLSVTQALSSEPPLPGTQAPGWQGLDEATPRSAQDGGPTADPHGHHRGHHAH